MDVAKAVAEVLVKLTLKLIKLVLYMLELVKFLWADFVDNAHEIIQTLIKLNQLLLKVPILKVFTLQALSPAIALNSIIGS
jgi:hypothetical protein